MYRWDDGFIVVFSDGVDEAVYPRLREAIEGTELNHVTDTARDMTSSEFSQRNSLHSRCATRQLNTQTLINGEPWQAEDSGTFRRSIAARSARRSATNPIRTKAVRGDLERSRRALPYRLNEPGKQVTLSDRCVIVVNVRR